MARSPIRNWFRKQSMPRTSLRLSRLEDRTVPANISGTIYQDWAGNGILNNNDPGAAGQTAFLDANNNGILDVTGGTFTALDTPLDIPDFAGGPGLANSVTSVSGVSGTVADVNVQVDITHTWDSDLILTLIGPNGTRVILANRRGGSGDNFTGTTFDDQAAASITTGVAPFTGSFRPEEVLSAFNGLSGTDVNGNWTLEVTDNAGADIGTINSFSVTIVGQSEQSAVADASGLFTFTGLAAGNYNVRSVLPAGQTATGPAVYNVVLGASDVTGRDFGRLNQNAIYGTAFGDTNNNGVLDGAETRTPGVTAYIDANGNNQLDFQNQTTASTDPPVDIPDFAGGVPGFASMPINISGYNQTITDVNVTVNITHTFVGDLILTLVSPGGTRVVLSNRRGGSNDNFVGTVFDDQAADPIDITPSPAGFPGSFRPDEPLSAFNGLSGAAVNGAWALEVTDNAGIDIGTIDSVSIELTGGERSAVTDSLGNFRMDNVAPGAYSVRAVAPAGLVQTLPAANGSYAVNLAAGGTSNNKDFGFGTGGAQAPTVTGTTVNGGATQRSRVTSIDVTFSTQVTFASTAANAFTLTRNSGGTVSFTATANVVGGVTVVTLNGFTGATTDFGSLADGRYTLTTLASQVSAGGTNMTSNATYGDANGLFRFYGDTTADRRLDIADFGPFSLAYLQSANYNATLDFNQDGRIDIADFGQFSVRYFTTLP